jgi:type I restriction enzyme S subunit
MSRLDELIKELCPDGVPYKSLGEFGYFYGGLSGKSKDDFSNGNAKLITYMNVYSNLAVDTEISDMVKIEDNEKQNTVEYGDVLFTGSSETPDECGISSVLTKEPKEKLYLNSFCFGFRLIDKDLLLPDFSKYLFRSGEIRKQINRTASGVTRFNVSKKKMEQVLVPLPPLPVQQEIVRILDNFTELTTELTAELTTRRKQYEYYRKLLLNFDTQRDIPFKWTTVAQVCTKISSGGTPSTSIKDYYGGNIPWLRTQEVDFSDIYDTGVKITEEGLKNSSANWIPANCVIVAMYGATAAKVAINKIPLTTNQACCNLQIDEEKAMYKYVFHWLSSQYQKLKAMGQGSQSNINAKTVKDFPIPIPPLEEQARIVAILDKFDALCNDLTNGLPAEIEARQKQYEYYRDKLLTFKEATK